MSAVVCGKRSNIFEESPSSPPLSKRIRYLSSSPSRPFWFSAPLDHLLALFPDMDRQFLEKALEESGDDLDSAIKRLNELRLSTAESVPDVSQEINAQVANSETSATREESSGGSSFPASGAEWVELLVGQVLNASNVDDAKARVSQALEALEKSICANATEEAARSFQKEKVMLKQHLEAVIQENTVLKRAVSIQHERQKEFEEMGQEMQKLKEVVSQYQEQVRSLEVNNYALAMHLKQAQQNNSISGRFHPDVF
ncbi:uncharacterized protein LOC121748860 isoform X2 [Salvia splendens]|uniref:uncharacterized protein LOC121748860 isoform X2 n=1 Tax=Salvia splendens TaxID=180675 RepID=UPI001C27F268|nr:uncharacterized protein LOC121748860 isoform X2 [Salvia splendens]